MIGLFRTKLSHDFFHGACDVHCHLLPGVDDGFKTVEASVEALRLLEEHGIEKMVFTPHFMKEYAENDRESILAKFEAFKAEAEKACKIELRLAAEYMLDVGFRKHFKQGFLTLDKGGRNVLCETSYMMYEHDASEMLYEIMLEGYQPVIAHPERYEYASRKDYQNWKDKDYLFQLNLLSLAGAYGGEAVAKSHYMLKQGMYDFVGSDMHNVDNYKRFLPLIKLDKKEMEQLRRLIENNRNLLS